MSDSTAPDIARLRTLAAKIPPRGTGLDHGDINEIVYSLTELLDAAERAEAAVAALDMYGRHEASCNLVCPPMSGKCTCGFSAAYRAAYGLTGLDAHNRSAVTGGAGERL